jgi:hypothetical protein
VQRDKKLMSYDIVDKSTKPYIKVKVSGEDKVRHVSPALLHSSGLTRCKECDSV